MHLDNPLTLVGIALFFVIAILVILTLIFTLQLTVCRVEKAIIGHSFHRSGEQLRVGGFSYGDTLLWLGRLLSHFFLVRVLMRL